MNTIKRFRPLALFSAIALMFSVLAGPVHAGLSTGSVPSADQTVQAGDYDKDRDDRQDDNRDGQGGTGQPGW